MRWAHWSSSWPTWSPNGCFDHWMWFFHIFPLFSLITWGLGFIMIHPTFSVRLFHWIVGQSFHRIYTSMENRNTDDIAGYCNAYACGFPCKPWLASNSFFGRNWFAHIFFMIFGTIWFLQPTSRSGSHSYTTKVDTSKSKRLGPSSLVLQRSLVDVHSYASSRTSLDCWGSGIKSTKHSSVWRAMGTIMQRNLFQFQRTFCQSKKNICFFQFLVSNVHSSMVFPALGYWCSLLLGHYRPLRDWRLWQKAQNLHCPHPLQGDSGRYQLECSFGTSPSSSAEQAEGDWKASRSAPWFYSLHLNSFF